MLRQLIDSLINIVYPKICLVCKHKLQGISSIDNLICLDCWSRIKRNLPPFCLFCGRQLKLPNFTKNICSSCINSRWHFDRAFSPCIYEGVIKELIHIFKYKNKDYLGLPLSRLMIEYIEEYNVPVDFIDLIIPIPLHKTRLREREFNQAQILSNYIAKKFNKLTLDNFLMRNRYTQTQTDLEPHKRILNVMGSFSVIKNDGIKSKNILLVDDVLTTGATASEAASALKGAGANIVFVLTLAN